MAQPPVNGVYRAVWPVADDTLTRDELIAEAKFALAALAAESDIIITGPATWDTTRTGSEVPDWEHWDGYVLVAEAPARGRNATIPVVVEPVGPEPVYVDWVVIERALAEAAPRKLSRDEKKAAVHVGERRGITRKALADRLGMAAETVRTYAQADPTEWTVAA